MNISENTSGINAIGLYEKESNPWTLPVTGRLISLSRIPNKKQKIPVRILLENLLDKPLRNPYEGTSNLRFEPDPEENPFWSSSKDWVPILPTFFTWKSTNDIYTYNILKDKGPAKRKVTFGQTITTPPSNLLSGKQLRYQTRYQTRSNNSSKELPNDDDDDDDNDDNNNNNNSSNHQPNQLPNQPPPPPPNQNMNNGNGGGNNPSDG